MNAHRATLSHRTSALALRHAGPDPLPEATPAGSGPSARLLAVGLAFVFVYAATSTLLDPSAFRSYLPPPVAWWEPSTVDLLLRAFAGCEVALAAAVLTRRYRYEASLLSALALVGIVAVNLDAFEVLFRNVAIAFAAVALATMSRGASELGGRKARQHVDA